MTALHKFADVYYKLVLSHRFARYNKLIVVAVAAIISGLSVYYGNDAVSTVADALGVVGVFATPNADPAEVKP